MITINNRLQKENLYNLFAQITTAIANPHRLELLDLLVQIPRTVEELAREAHMSIYCSRLRPASGSVCTRPGFCLARPTPLLLFCARNQTLRPA